MGNLFCHIGNGEYVSAHHAIALIQPGSVTARRRVAAAKKLTQYIDASHGKGIKAYILLDNNSVVASHISTGTLAKRFAADFDTTGDSDSYNSSLTQAQMIDTEVDTEDDEDDLPFTDFEEDMETDE